MWKRKAAQNKGVHDGELSGDAANSEREHEHREKTKSFLLRQNAKSNTNILTDEIQKHREWWLRFNQGMICLSLSGRVLPTVKDIKGEMPDIPHSDSTFASRVRLLPVPVAVALSLAFGLDGLLFPRAGSRKRHQLAQDFSEPVRR